MKVNNVEKQENSSVKMTISIEKEEWDAALSAAFKKNAVKINVPGFRRGKAPRKMIEKMYGEGVFYQDAVNATYADAYDKAVEEENLEPVEQPEIDVLEIDGNGYSFTAVFHVIPEIEIGQYKGLSAYMPPIVVSDEEIEEEIERMRNRNASLVAADRAAQMGDTVLFDYEGFSEGEAFEGGKGEQYSLELGSGRFIPGFEEGLVGVEAGQSLDVELTFPEEYHADHLAGKPAVFKCLVHEVKEKQLPELDDEFAKDVSEFDTLEEYRTSIRDRILHTREHEVSRVFEESLMDQILETMKGEIPGVMVEDQLQNILNDFNYRLSMQGLNLQTYMQMTGASAEDIQAQYRPIAERQVKSGLVFDKVAELEKMTVTEDDMESEYNRLAGVYNMETGDVKARISEKSLRHDILALKASELIRDSAVKLDTPPQSQEEEKTEEAPKPSKMRKSASKKEKAAESAEE